MSIKGYVLLVLLVFSHKADAINDHFKSFLQPKMYLIAIWNAEDSLKPPLIQKSDFGFSGSAGIYSSFYTTNNVAGANSLLPLTSTSIPVQSEKFRVQLNVAGFNPDTIRTRVEGRKVFVEAKQEERQVNGDFSMREIRKTYDLPEHAGKTLNTFV